MSESIREVRSDEVEILQDIAKRTFYHTFKSSYDDSKHAKIFDTLDDKRFPIWQPMLPLW